MPKVIFTVGLPRCGKSTFCKEFRKSNPNTVIVRADDIRLAYGFRYNSLLEKQVAATKETMLITLMKEDYDYILVDGTHTSEKSIKDIIKIAPEAQPKVIITHPQTCKDRAAASYQSDLVPVIDRMWTNLQNTLDTQILSEILEDSFKSNTRDMWKGTYMEIEKEAQSIMERLVQRLQIEFQENDKKLERIV